MYRELNCLVDLKKVVKNMYLWIASFLSIFEREVVTFLGTCGHVSLSSCQHKFSNFVFIMCTGLLPMHRPHIRLTIL